MADHKGVDRESWPDGLDSGSDRKVGDERSIRQSSDNGLEKACCCLISQGHVNAWYYGWSFFEIALKHVQEKEESQQKFWMQLHGAKTK